MNNCSKCKFGEGNYFFGKEIGDEYPVYSCSRGNDTSLDFECPDFIEYKPRKYREKNTKCDECEYLETCIREGNVIDCTTYGDQREHYIGGTECIKKNA